VPVIDKWLPFLEERDAELDMALALMAADIERLAKQKAPVKIGELVSSIQHVRAGLMHFQIWAGYQGPAMAYAAYQEYGQRRDGSHVVRNYTKAGTGKNYLRGSAKIVVDKGETYFKAAHRARL
jgi:hypothetical protein